jgi:hypothetical protein
MLPCPSPFAYNCPCGPCKEVVHLRNVSYYPSAQLLSVGWDLYKLLHPSYIPSGLHTVHAILEAIDSLQVKVSLHITTTFSCQWIICAQTLNPNGSQESIILKCNDRHKWTSIIHLVSRLQRFTSECLCALCQRLLLAFAMGQHSRLGECCQLQNTNTDFLVSVGRFL